MVDHYPCWHSRRIIDVLETEYERTESGIPKWLNINYDDVDRNDLFQTYELKDFDGTLYYSFEGAHEA